MSFTKCKCPCHEGAQIFCSCFGSCCPENHAMPQTLQRCNVCYKWIKIDSPTHDCVLSKPPRFDKVQLPVIKAVFPKLF